MSNLPCIQKESALGSPQEIQPEPNRLEQLAQLGEQIAQLSANIDAATYKLLCAIREFDQAEGWAAGGFRSCAHWLSWRIGWDLVTAREKVRVARALEKLPQLSAAFSRGEVSYSKIRCLVGVATAQNEADLLGIAKGGTASHVAQVVRAYRQVTAGQEEETARRHRVQQFLHTYTDDDGMLVLSGRLPPEVGAVVLKALDEACASLQQPLRRQENGALEMIEEDARASSETLSSETLPPVSYPARLRAEAMGLIAEAALSHGLEGKHRDNQHQLVLHAEVEALTADASSGSAYLEDGPYLANETARRLSCDCAVLMINHDSAGNVLDLGRKTRKISTPLWRALRQRDRCCRFPGCEHTRHLRGHHLEHWADGGETNLDNLCLLCRYHHFMVHEGGFEIRGPNAEKIQFYTPQGQLIEKCPQPPQLAENPYEELVQQNQQSGVQITSSTNLISWQGERLDLDWVILSTPHT